MLPAPPLTSIEDRISAREIAMVLFSVTSGHFDSYTQVIDRLEDAIENIRSAVGFYANEQDDSPVVLWDLLTGPITDRELSEVVRQVQQQKIADDVLVALLQDPEPIEFVTSASRAFTLVANLQLALRHPENTGASKSVTHAIASHLINAICSRHPAARPLLEAGWNPMSDRSRDEMPNFTRHPSHPLAEEF